jgi:D-alanyl-D-alanine carboxypeptidase
MTCRQIVRLLRDLREQSDREGPSVADILPATGCDPGTLTQFASLDDAVGPAALVAKTGTLTETDGGIAVLAGYARTARGERLFCIASPGIGRDVASARASQERWLIGLFEGQGGARSAECGAGVVYSDADASVREAERLD